MNAPPKATTDAWGPQSGTQAIRQHLTPIPSNLKQSAPKGAPPGFGRKFKQGQSAKAKVAQKFPKHPPVKSMMMKASGVISSKSAMRVPKRACVCGNLSSKNYYEEFPSGISFCANCWKHREGKIGFMLSLEKMKAYGVMSYVAATAPKAKMAKFGK
eukprot:GEMP01056402.1.p1 GENE.GEMP01056402.1~~GEMP01056402.1.p1  ORF type:complete len:157 (+),score=30.80 GEMP01056402.1:75-545(+)